MIMRRWIPFITIIANVFIFLSVFAFDISFISPTPENYLTTTNKSIIINTSIINASQISSAFIDYDNSLVAWYRFNNELNESNSFYIDWSNNKNHLRCSGTQCPSLTTSGRFGSARNFDGNNDFLISNNSDSFDFSNSNFTIDLWVYSTITDNNYHGILGYQNGSSTITRNVGLWVYQKNKLHVGFGNGTHLISYTTPDNVIATNAWTHVVVTFDEKYMLIYINGNLKYNLTNFMNQKPYPNKLITIGRIDNYYKGRIDEIKIFKRVLTADEIKSSYNASANRLYLLLTNQSLGIHSFIAYVQNASGSVNSTEKRFIEIVEKFCELNQSNYSSSCNFDSAITNITSNESIILTNNTNLTIQNLTNFTITTNSTFTIDKSSSLILDLGKCQNNCETQSLTISANQIVLEGNVITKYSLYNSTPKKGPDINLFADKIIITGNISVAGEQLDNNSTGDSGNIKLLAREIYISSTINLTGNKSGKLNIIANETLNISNATFDVRGRNANGTINITWGTKLDETNATFLGKLPIHTKNFENGSITFEGETDFRNISTDLEENLIVFNNFAFANSTKYPYLNRSAIITFYDLPWKGSEMLILKDGKVCTDCQLLYTNGSVSSFRVNSFSNYTTYSNITQCGSLSIGNTYYSLNTSITFDGITCLTVTANNVMIDGNGYSLIGMNNSNTKAIYANGRSDLKIYNLTILNVSTGIHLIGDAGDRIEIVNTSINMSFASGCSLGSAICEAIIISDVDDVIIRNVTTDTFYYGIALYMGNNNVTIKDSTLYARNYPTIQLRSLQTNITIFNNTIIRGTSGSTALELVTNVNSSNINISNNYVQSSDYGITISNDPENIFIINNTITFGTSRGIFISGLNLTNRARNILIQNNTLNGSYHHFRIDNYINNITFENNNLISNYAGNYIIYLNGNTQSNSNITIRNNNIQGRTNLMYIRQYLTNNTGTNEFLNIYNNIFNNSYPSDSSTYSNCVLIENNNSNIFFWNNTFICYRFFTGAPTNPPNYLHNLTNVWANYSDIGNRYIFRNGTEVWPLKNATDTDGNFFANVGSDLPFNHITMTTTHWLAFINDSHPYTLKRYTLCGEQINQSLTLNNSLNCSGTALYITADNVTLDCANFTINHSWSSLGTGVVIQNRTNITIRNCNINKFSSINGGEGIYIFNSSNIKIENTKIYTLGIVSKSLSTEYVNNLTLTNFTGIVSGYNSVPLSLYSTNNSKFSNLNLDVMNNPRAHVFLSHSYNNEFRTIILFNKSQLTQGPVWIYYSGNNYLGNVSNFSYNDIYFYDEYDIPNSSWNITIQWPIIVNITDIYNKPIFGAFANYSSTLYNQIYGNFSQTNPNGITIDYLNDTLLLGDNSNITYKLYNITIYVEDNSIIKQNSSIVSADSEKIINLTLTNLSDPLINFLPPTPLNNQIIYNDKNIILNSSIHSNTNAFGFYDLGDLIAYWSFDHFNSTHLIDLSRYNNHGTFAGNNNQSNVSGKFGYGFIFDGIDDRMIVSNSPSLNPSKEISIIAWFNAKDWASNRRILQKGYSDNQYRITAEWGSFKWHISGISEIAVSLPTLNQWHQVVGTYNGSEQRLYIDGVLNFTRSATIQLPNTNDNLEIGSKPNTQATGDRFNGTLDEIIIFSRVLNQDEVLASYNNNQTFLVRNISYLIQNYSSNYTIKVYAKNSLGNLTIVERNFSVYMKPYVILISPNNASSGNLGLRNFTCYANESISGLKNGSIFIYYSNGTLFYSNSTTLNDIAQNFTFTVNITTNDTYYLNCLAYDNLNNYTISENYTYYVSADNSIYSCSLLDTPNKEYVLGSDVFSQGTCFSVIADNITLDCNGYTIDFGNSQIGNGIFANSVRNITIKNCNIRQTNSSFNPVGWINGTYFFNTNNSKIINTTIFT
ncbi:MAG: LamG domain-containing protein, partial [Candidatus Anstonellales archaeon]